LGFTSKFFTDETIRKTDLSSECEAEDFFDLKRKSLALNHKIYTFIDEFFEKLKNFQKTGSFENFENLDKEIFFF
jgi:hypothetical protein